LISTEYAGNYVYESGVLQFFNTAEGYVEPKGTGWEYVFQYKDHLENTRLSYSDADGNGIIAQTEIREENNYYPFGLEHKGYNNVVTSTNPAQNYKYNGKELQDELGLNMYDYGWRNYMPDIGRWSQSDPLLNDLKFAHDINDVDPDDREAVYMAIINDAEVGGGIYNTDNLNPYGYGYNNPVSFDDPDGRCPSCIWGAVIGAAVEYGGQVIANRIEGKSWGESISDIDVSDVLVSAGEGALTGGVSAIRSVAAKTAVTVGSEIIKNTLDVKVKEGKPIVKVNDAKSVARNTVIGLAVNGAGKAIPSTKVKVKSEITPKQAVKTARAAGPVTTAQRKEIQNQAKKTLKENKAINKTVNGSPGATVSGGTAETVKRKEDKANGN